MTTQAPAVSVVIATRNRRLMLAEAIATVKDQSFADWELIVVDDASTDDTQTWLETQRDPRLRVFRQEARGERAVARNRGLAEARGAFVMFLDDDDLLRAEALAALVAALRAHPEAVAAIAPCRILLASGDSLKVYWPSRAIVRVMWKEFLFGFWANSGQNLFRADAARAVGGYPAAWVPFEDRSFWLAIARRGPVCMVPTMAMDYRIHAGQSKRSEPDPGRTALRTEFINTLTPRERAQGWRIRRAAELAQESEDAWRAARFGKALLRQLAACWTAPYLLSSPATGRPLWWGIKKCLLRQSAP
jgi:glycosyltransferase involved in cell wall biosynthesis